MAGTLLHGDILIGQSLSEDETVRAGDVVEIKHRELGQLVKRIVNCIGDEFWVGGDSMTSLESERIGKVTRDQILAKFLLRLSPKGINLIT